MVVTLVNDFHGTSTAVRPSPLGVISPRAAARAARKLCGVRDCCCGGVRGGRYALVPCAGDCYLVVDRAAGDTPRGQH